MLSYQHQYHAGNHADVLKHWVLLQAIRHLQKKDKAFDYIDTHAGNGLYRLNSAEAEKTGEAKVGVLKLIDGGITGIDDYLQQIAADIDQNCYPGSALLATRLLRPGDHGWLFELHPRSFSALKKYCEGKGRFIEQTNGLAGLLRLLPNKSHRALVLIDPSYEVKSDYQKVVEVMSAAYRKMPQTVMLLWYPVVNRQQIDRLEKQLINSGMRHIQLFEMGVADDEKPGMTASGMIVVNPPWTLKTEFEAIFASVSACLARDHGSRIRSLTLVAE